MKYIFFVFFSIYSLIIVAQSKNLWVIQLASMRDFNINEVAKYNDLNTYGEVYHKTYSNGTTRIYLRDLNGKGFISKDKVSSILKAIKKSKFKKKYKKIFAEEIENNDTFISPKVEVKERELIVSFKLNEPNNPVIPQPVPDILPTPPSDIRVEDKKTEATFWVRLGFFKEIYIYSVQKKFKLEKSVEIKAQASVPKKGTSFICGNFKDVEKAKELLKEVQKYSKIELYILEYKQDENTKKMIYTRVFPIKVKPIKKNKIIK